MVSLGWFVGGRGCFFWFVFKGIGSAIVGTDKLEMHRISSQACMAFLTHFDVSVLSWKAVSWQTSFLFRGPQSFKSFRNETCLLHGG